MSSRSARANVITEVPWEHIATLLTSDEILLNCAEPDAEQRMKEEGRSGFAYWRFRRRRLRSRCAQCSARSRTYAQWDGRLDGLLAGAVMSLQAVKAVEIGAGVSVSARWARLCRTRSDTTARERIFRLHSCTEQRGRDRGRSLQRARNTVRGYLKPISTLRRPLGSVDLRPANR